VPCIESSDQSGDNLDLEMVRNFRILLESFLQVHNERCGQDDSRLDHLFHQLVCYGCNLRIHDIHGFMDPIVFDSRPKTSSQERKIVGEGGSKHLFTHMSPLLDQVVRNEVEVEKVAMDIDKASTYPACQRILLLLLDHWRSFRVDEPFQAMPLYHL